MRFWDIDNSVCYVSNKKKNKASPSLRSCYTTTDQACCNFVEDEAIGGVFGSFIPGPCADDHTEITLFQCIACRGEAVKYTIKAETSAGYFKRISKLQGIQESTTNIKREMSSELMADKYKKGYVKVCATWLLRLWGHNSTTEMTELSKPTEIFDSCGAYDLKNDGNPIAKGSKFSAWKDALSFLEWYGIPHMDGFGIIIMDDTNPTKYATVPGEVLDTDGRVTCFERATYIGAAVATAAVSLGLLVV